MITADLLKAICLQAPLARLEPFVGPLNLMFEEFSITTPARQSQFLPQAAHESADFRYLKELASGEDYEGPSRLAAKLGNTQMGDGKKFKGRGILQITGRKNYGLCAGALNLPLLDHPELLEQISYACRSAGWFWTVGAGLNLSKRAIDYGVPVGVDLNDLADAGDFQGITLAINGGLNGVEDRLAHLERAQITIT